MYRCVFYFVMSYILGGLVLFYSSGIWLSCHLISPGSKRKGRRIYGHGVGSWGERELWMAPNLPFFSVPHLRELAPPCCMQYRISPINSNAGWLSSICDCMLISIGILCRPIVPDPISDNVGGRFLVLWVGWGNLGVAGEGGYKQEKFLTCCSVSSSGMGWKNDRRKWYKLWKYFVGLKKLWVNLHLLSCFTLDRTKQAAELSPFLHNRSWV